MTDFNVSIDEFMSRRKSSSRDAVTFKSTKAPASWVAEKRTGRFVMTTQGKDRDGDIVFTAGIDTTEFMKNPICLLNHRSSDPIGTWDQLAKGADQMDGDVALAPAGTTPEVDKAAGLLSAGILRAASIGFIPKTVKRIVLEDGTPTWSFEIVECELVECSIVSIPANPMALAKGSSSDPLSLPRDLIEEILDTYTKDPATGLIVPKAEYEAAHKILTGDRTTVVVDGKASPGLLKSIAEGLKGMFLPAAAEIVALGEAEAQAAEAKAAAMLAAQAAEALAEATLSR